MAIAISTPENGFIQFGSQPDLDECFDEMGLCLQVNQFTDLQFQISILQSTSPKPASTDFNLYLANTDCEPYSLGYSNFKVGSFDWVTSLDGLRWIGTLNFTGDNITSAKDARFFSDGSCFKMDLQGASGYRYRYHIPLLTFPLSTNEAILGSGGDQTATDFSPTLISNVDALTTLLNAHPPIAGVWSNDGTDLLFIPTTSTYRTTKITPLTLYNGSHVEQDSFDGALEVISTIDYGCTNCFIYTPDVCFTTLVKYRCNENAFGFDYNNDSGGGNTLSGFYNQVRLSMFRKNPQTITKKKVYRKSDGNYVKLSSVMEKEIPVEVDWLNDDWHTKIAIGLEHDDLQFYNEVLQVWEPIIFDDGETYVVNWAHNDRGTNFALAPADFKIKKMPFANFNANCE